MPDAAFVIVAAVFGLWLAASAAGQFGARSRWLRARALGWSLPEWRLFAPDPGDHDFHLVYRCRLSTGECGEFEMAAIYSRAPLRPIWNPEARKQKMLRDTVRALGNSAGRYAADKSVTAGSAVTEPFTAEWGAAMAEISRLAPYRLLLGVAAGRCAAGATGVQFAVLRETPGKSLDLYFVSAWHELPAAPGTRYSR